MLWNATAAVGRKISLLKLAGALPLVVLALATCDGSDDDQSSGSASPTAPLAVIPGELRPLVFSVWGFSADDVWFAGGQSGKSGRLLAHYDGTSISRVATPPGPTLWWVWGSDPDQIWACGNGGQVLARRGGQWVTEVTPLSGDAVLYGVWGSSDTDLWAVGGSPLPAGPKGIVLRSTGDGVWSQVVDASIPSDKTLFKVWGSGPNDVHLVGEDGTALHFDGKAFRRVDVAESTLLFTVHGQKDGPILLVGGASRGTILRFDGQAWVDDGPPPDIPALSAVFVRPDGTAIAAGVGQVLLRDTAGKWRPLQDEDPTGVGRDTLHGLWSGPDLWAVGGDVVRGKYGLIATTRRPWPTLQIGPPLALDAGVDASKDAAIDVVDAAADVIVDVSFDAADTSTDAPLDASLDATVDAPSDSGPDVAPDALPGPGEPCGNFMCSGSLQCLIVADPVWAPYCMEQCSAPGECVGYGANPCCVIPGPQLNDTYCIPNAVFPNGCP